MTAATHPVELFIPGTNDIPYTKTPDVLLKPAMVTDEVRRRMAAEVTFEQKISSLLVLATCLGFAVVVAFSMRERDITGMQMEALRPVVMAGALILMWLHHHFRRQRRFIAEAPSAIAEVVARRVPRYTDEESSLAAPRLLLRYLPRPAEEGPNDDALHPPDAHVLWAELDGFSAKFERSVHAGDRVSILYDPTDLQHVRVVDV